MSRMKKPVKKPASNSVSVPEKNRPVGISLRLSLQLSKNLELYCSYAGVSKNSVISLSLADFLSDRGFS